MSSITFENVTKRYGDVTAVRSLDLEINDTEFVVLLGPSGCGKSTALRMIAGLEEITEGTLRIGERVVNNIEPQDRDVAMVFQSYALYPHMTVAKNIESPLRAGSRANRLPAAERNQRVADAADTLGLTDYLKRKPAALSGGQRQRVALARAIVRRPKAFLMDEPLSNLDAKLRTATRAELVELHQRLETTFVYVTHDQVEAMTMATQVAIMNDGELQQTGTPRAVYETPANLFVARFIGSPPMSTIEGTIATAADGTVGLMAGSQLIGLTGIPAGSDGRRAVVGVRPEHLVVDGGGALTGTVAGAEWLGHERHLLVDLPTGETGSNRVIARASAEGDAPRLGTEIRLGVDASRTHAFDAETGSRLDAELAVAGP